MGKFEWGGDEKGESPSPGSANQPPTISHKMGSAGGSLREMLKMLEYHNPDLLCRLIGKTNEAAAMVDGIPITCLDRFWILHVGDGEEFCQGIGIRDQTITHNFRH